MQRAPSASLLRNFDTYSPRLWLRFEREQVGSIRCTVKNASQAYCAYGEKPGTRRQHMQLRSITGDVTGRPTIDGAGVRLVRVLG